MKKSLALKTILLFGIVSLLGDVIYEGCKGVTGPFLSLLGASAFIIGAVSGAGEFLSYALRFPAGRIADKKRWYWEQTFLGYSLILCIPLLALVWDWRIAALLLLLERVGKGIRSPARDAILSHVVKTVGAGRGFAVHEILDQIGAILGPLIFSLILFKANYTVVFSVMWLPFFLLLISLSLARKFSSPFPRATPTIARHYHIRPLVFFTFVAGLGLLPFPVLAYHFTREGMEAYFISILYALVMGADAGSAYLGGILYDKSGIKSLMLLPLFCLFAPLAFMSSTMFLGIISLGFAIGIQETVLRAVVADLVPAEKRGSAYGGIQSAFGLAFLMGNSICGLLYELGLTYLFLYVTTCELLALVLFIQWISRQ